MAKRMKCKMQLFKFFRQKGYSKWEKYRRINRYKDLNVTNVNSHQEAMTTPITTDMDEAEVKSISCIEYFKRHSFYGDLNQKS